MVTDIDIVWYGSCLEGVCCFCRLVQGPSRCTSFQKCGIPPHGLNPISHESWCNFAFLPMLSITSSSELSPSSRMHLRHVLNTSTHSRNSRIQWNTQKKLHSQDWPRQRGFDRPSSQFQGASITRDRNQLKETLKPRQGVHGCLESKGAHCGYEIRIGI